MDTQKNANIVKGSKMAQQETVLIKITRGTFVNGEYAKKNSKVECSPADARFLIGIGKAEEANPRKARAKPATTAAAEESPEE
jgi:hypothetical protein